jgi:hypothetical protein
MTDALELFRAARPRIPITAEPPSSGRGRELHDLAMVPGSPSYRARIPPPPCYQCGEDHVPGQDYGHAWTPEPPPLQQVHDEPVSAAAIIRKPQVIEQPVLQAFRVALYVGRGDTYVVTVETPPDWDQAVSWKVQPDLVLPLINLARALGQKVVDKTGGDLLMLEQEAAGASQYAQADGGRAAPAGGGQPRRTGPDPDGPPQGEPERAETADGGVPGGGSQRRRATR